MKATQLLLFLLSAISSGYAQTYSVGVQTITFIDSSRSNRSIPVEIHYPATSTGNNTPIASDSFPFVVFGHGFVMTASCYYPFSDTLATRGYIFAFPTTESSFSPSHADFAQDLIFVYNKLISENSDTSSPFYQHVIAKGAIAGHSMGGGCTVLSASYSNPAECYFTFAEATTNPSSITAAPSMTKPYLSFAGSYDCIAPYTTNQLPTYDSSGSPCKFLIEVTGASHCQWGVSNSECSLGESLSSCANPPLSETAQISTGLSYLEPYLDYYLKNLSNAFENFDSVYTADTADVRATNCLAFPLGMTDVSSLHTRIYPNPATNMVDIQADKNISELRLIDYTGKTIIQESLNAQTTDLNVSNLAAGIYLVEMTSNDGQRSTMKFSKE
jgi:dienelactone hydrolase